MACAALFYVKIKLDEMEKAIFTDQIKKAIADARSGNIVSQEIKGHSILGDIMDTLNEDLILPVYFLEFQPSIYGIYAMSNQSTDPYINEYIMDCDDVLIELDGNMYSGEHTFRIATKTKGK